MSSGSGVVLRGNKNLTFFLSVGNSHRALDKREYLVIIRDNFC